MYLFMFYDIKWIWNAGYLLNRPLIQGELFKHTHMWKADKKQWVNAYSE